MHFQVDTDEHPRIKYYYYAKHEPHFLILLNGAELGRVTGYNMEHLHQKLEHATELHYKDFNYKGDTGSYWEEFTDFPEYQSRFLDRDRDNTNLYWEHQDLAK